MLAGVVILKDFTSVQILHDDAVDGVSVVSETIALDVSANPHRPFSML